MDVKEWVLSQKRNMLDMHGAHENTQCQRTGNKGVSLRGGLRHGIGQSVGDREANGL